jgi:hypothetical protein
MDYPESESLDGYDAMLFGPHMARRWNCGLNLYIRVRLSAIDPPDGAATGTRADWGGVQRRIRRWPEGEFRLWSSRYQRECQAFWTGKFWLRTPDTYNELDFRREGVRYRPNIACHFYLSLVQLSSSAHHQIEVVRLADDEPYFRSDSAHYDHRDLDPATYGPGLVQRAHVHEVGHLLGLGHSGEGQPGCVNHSPQCYAGSNVMGQGEDLDATNARPWQKAMDEITDIDWNRWQVSMTELLPRRLP